MAASVTILKTMKNHPWDDVMETFTLLGMPAIIFKIDGGHSFHASVGKAFHESELNTNQMSSASSLSEAILNFNMIANSPSAKEIIGPSVQNKGPGFIGKIVSHQSVFRGLQILHGLLSEPISAVISISGTLDFEGIDLRILGRETVGDSVFLLVSSYKSADFVPETSQSQQYQGALDASIELLMTITLDGKVNIINQGIISIIGPQCAGEVLDISACLTPASVDVFSQAASKLLKGSKPWTGHLELASGQKKSGVLADCRISAMLGVEKHQLVGYCISGYRTDTDNFLSDHINPLKASLSQGQRFSMIGKMAGNIIHEINNPITVINGKSEKIQWLMQKKDTGISAEEGENASQCAEKILKMTDRIKRIIAGMKNISRSAEGEPFVIESVLKLTEEVHGLLDIICQKSGLTLDFVPGDPSINIRMQYLSLSQVLVNLLSNGLDAVKGIQKAWLALRIEVEADWLYIKIVDSGSGVPEHVKAHLFENYFTTKELGQGTGIGLPLSLEIVKRHGGDLYLDQMAENTTFVVKLPRRDGLIPSQDGDGWEEI